MALFRSNPITLREGVHATPAFSPVRALADPARDREHRQFPRYARYGPCVERARILGIDRQRGGRQGQLRPTRASIRALEATRIDDARIPGVDGQWKNWCG